MMLQKYQRPSLMTEEDMSKAKEYMLETLKTKTNDLGYFNYTATYAGYPSYDFTLFGACHSSVERLPVTDKAVLTFNNGSPVQKELKRPFLKWLLTDSFVAEYILNRDDFDFCEKVGFIVNMNVPAPVLQLALVLTRHFREVAPACFSLWNELTEGGLHPFIAYELTFNTSLSTGTPYANKDWYIHPFSTHRVHATLNPLYYKEALKGEFGTVIDRLYEKGTWRSVKTSYTGGSNIFYRSKDISFRSSVYTKMLAHWKTCTELINVIATHRKKSAEIAVYRPPNPFSMQGRPELNDALALTYSEYREVVIPYIQNVYLPRIMKEIEDEQNLAKAA